MLLWAIAQRARLPSDALRRIETQEIFVSVASIWEIGIKVALGKLMADPRMILAAIEPSGFALLPIVGEHTVVAAEFPQHHRDPFDRMLIAQANCGSMSFLTNDRFLRAYGEVVTVLWLR